MSNLDQCPSTVHGEKQKPSKAELAGMSRVAGTVNGLQVWRSAEDLADTSDFRDWMEKEFPAGASELSRAEGEDASAAGGETRRTFLKIMGASLALAGAATVPGCRRPDHKILPYSKEVPEEVVPGKPLFYATSMPRPDGGAEGLLVETHEGRPTKIEGNPMHPTNRGKASTWALASIMSLYDPDRLNSPVYNNPARGKVLATWDDFRAWGVEHFAQVKAGGEGLAFVVGKASSPTRRAIASQLKAKYPKAIWVDYSPSESRGGVEGTRIALGAPMREVLNISKSGTRVILSLDRDFLYHEAEELANARGFAKSREVLTTADEMSRLYMVESGWSITGGQADHRLALAPSQVATFAVELARFLLPKLGDAKAAALVSAIEAVALPAGREAGAGYTRFLEECAKDILNAENRGKTLIVAGPSQPGPIHALVAALNGALGNIGNSVAYFPLTEDEASDSRGNIASLVAKMVSGAVSTLVCVGANPAYDAPGFAEAMAKVGASITLSVEATETAHASTWSLNGASYLESWGDTIASDGTISPVQPMIAPLYEPAMSEIEFLALLGGKDLNAKVDGYQIVRDSWKSVLKTEGRIFEQAWRRALHDGILPGTQKTPAKPGVDLAKVAAAIGGLKLGAVPSGQSLDVAMVIGHTHDGRYANIAWLQELPEVGTRTVWDNPVLMSPRTAEALGVLPEGFSRNDDMGGIYTTPTYPTAQVVEVKVGDRVVKAAAWILPGMADNTLLCTLGYGREHAGRVGDGVGFNFYPLLKNDALATSGAMVTKLRDTMMVASTQNHWSMAGRTSIVRAVDLPAWKKHGDAVQDAVDTFYHNQDRVAKLNFAERLGELKHNPPAISIYTNPFNRSKADPDAKNVVPGNPSGAAYQRNTPPQYTSRPQWAMTIDQNACTGCGACTIACQAENNIPVVGKKEVAKGREMSWIRVDRYFTGDMDGPAQMLHQPVACVHCENAPCETVCPVNATVHGPEGINYMTYNRCIGTRYCANNCPYKVRRFNFFDYGVTKFNGDYLGQELLDKAGDLQPGAEGITGSGAFNKINPNLIPPRLRDKLDEISRMQKNPDVTVRSRGVMEKCSYCIQRINSAKIETKLQGLDGIPEGFFQSACQQACPSDAIVFGDMLLETSRVKAMRGHARSYALLGYLATRPRTSHMVRVMNPNPALCDAARKESWENPFEHGEHGEHGAHGDGHEGHDEHGTEHPGEPGAHSFFDSTRGRADRGYALSLRVLGGSHA